MAQKAISEGAQKRDPERSGEKKGGAAKPIPRWVFDRFEEKADHLGHGRPFAKSPNGHAKKQGDQKQPTRRFRDRPVCLMAILPVVHQVGEITGIDKTVLVEIPVAPKIVTVLLPIVHKQGKVLRVNKAVEVRVTGNRSDDIEDLVLIEGKVR